MTVDPIARKLRIERFKAGRSQRDVGREAGVGQSMVSEWESGSVVPTISSVRSWAAVLGFELILVEVPEPQPADSKISTGGPAATSPAAGPEAPIFFDPPTLASRRFDDADYDGHCPEYPDCREERYVRDEIASVKAGEPVGKWVSGCSACKALAGRAAESTKDGTDA